MNNKLISQLTKTEILKLPGFSDKSKLTVKQLKELLKKSIRRMKISKRGLRVNQYISAYKEMDNQLFKNIQKNKQNRKTQKQARKQYKQSLKTNARNEREIMNIGTDLYSATRTEARNEYKQRIKDVKDKKQFKKHMKEFMVKANKEISFEVDIADDEDKRLAFTETLRQIHKNSKAKVVVKSESLDGNEYKWFTLSKAQNIDTTIGHIAGTIDLADDCSDVNPWVENSFIPTKYQLLFIKNNKKNDSNVFSITKQDEETNKLYEEEIEIDDKYREKPDGGFFPYINLSSIDLSQYQIFKKVDKKNYKDNCLVYACIQSNVFTNEEINQLRYMVKTRMIPNNQLYQIAKTFKCHIIVRRIEEKYGTKHEQQVMIDTRKKGWANSFNRTVDMILYKKHYFINKPIDGKKPMHILRKLFAEGMFREINACEMNILSTNEYTNSLNDYVDLDYDVSLCCKPIDSNEDKKPRKWSRIYYSDFETDTTQSPHIPYLNCTVYRTGNQIHKMVFEGENIAERLLKSLESNSLTYFHNLKYDACFFINTPGWDVQITERTGTILQIVLTKYKQIGKATVIDKRLTFRNSYSIIPAPLRSFADMFHLEVHKEVMAYRLYTEHNIKRRYITDLEFQLQYYRENKDNKSLKQIKQDWIQLMNNCKEANAIVNEKIDIIKYAIYYCKLDCVVLMKGVEKFNDDLEEVFKQTNTQMNSVHNYISISSIGYNYAFKYGCFDGCYQLSGKPQNFIQRCVSGGRTMCANNEKQYIEGKIQDFDAVSLYPSAMSIMDGVPKGTPKIIPKDISKEELLKYNQFFAEINITRIKCKSNTPYKFGQLFSRNNEGSKIFNNEPTNHFFIDKIGFKDLMEFYDFDYEFIRGYYFNEGFNDRINKFIEKLFNLRLKYKKQNNPLQSTIKLLLNSIYGKSILKAITSEIKCVPKESMIKYIWNNYNYITEITENKSIDNVYVKKVKPINNHFNLPQFGASVLSWSKHLMNQVMSTAEQNDIDIFYTDTDSLHLFEADLPRLAMLFKSKYSRELIGAKMTQFHCDFDSFDGSVGKIYSKKLIALGKKSYLDILVDEKGNEGYHVRLKGIPKQCIINKCKRLGITVEELYERLYKGEEITFDLLDGSNCFKKSKSYQQINLPAFNRKVKF